MANEKRSDEPTLDLRGLIEGDPPGKSESAKEELARNKQERLKLVNPDIEQTLDDEEEKYRKLRRDLPGVSGMADTGIVSFTVSKIPGKNEFFRTHPHPDYQPVFDMVDDVRGLEKILCLVDTSMVVPLVAIGIIPVRYRLYLCQTSNGKNYVVPVKCETDEGARNEYTITKEIGLREGMRQWVRLYTDRENQCYRVYPAPPGRFGDEANWPQLPWYRVFQLAFEPKGIFINNPNHALYLKWSARDTDR